MAKINILGVNVNIEKKADLVGIIKGFFDADLSHTIVTVNPEIILKAIKDEEYFYCINHADINTVDGTGVKIAGWLVGKRLQRLTGVELTIELLNFCEKNSKKVCILNWNQGLSKNAEITASLKRKYPQLDFKVFDIPRSRSLNKDLVGRLNNFSPQLILNALGNPEQEILNHKLKGQINSARVLVGIGGTLDLLTGKKPQTPVFWKNTGLEWLWRLFNQPVKDLPEKRGQRIYNAFFNFVLKFMEWRFILPFKYRPNVACCLYKKEGDKTKVLIVERSDEPGHWQLPQGGTGRLGLAAAGYKEITEEIGNFKVKTIETIPNLYKYDFHFTQAERGKSSYQRGAICAKHTGYRGQKQGLWIGEYCGSDEDISVNYWDHRGWQWVDLDDLIEAVDESRREAVIIYLEEFNKMINIQ